MEVKVRRVEKIKPSLSTPPHLRIHRLSFLDQLEPLILTPFVYFFSPDHVLDPDLRSSLIKRSLSQALTLFYPLAGRIVHNLYVDCNDEGVQFVETHVSCRLSHALECSDDLCRNLEKLFPARISDQTNYAAAVQFNVFECGGVAIGIGVSHRVGDASSYFEFVRSWAVITRGDSGVERANQNWVTPRVVSDEIFPRMSPIEHDPRVVPIETLVTKRFVFSEESLAAVRGKYGRELRLSRVEALSEFLLQRHVETTLKTSPDMNGSQKYMVSYVINLRPRLNPPLTARAFGNIITTFHFKLAFPRDHNENGECNLVPLVRTAMAGANSPDFMSKFQERRGQTQFLKERLDRVHETSMEDDELGVSPQFLNFASLSRFPVYDADFGWGKPEWVGFVGSCRPNHVVFMDRKEGNGIDAYVALKGKEMSAFEKDKEILVHVESTTARSSPTRSSKPRM